MDSRFIYIFCGTGLIVATSGLVFAADMAVKAPPPPPHAVWDWSGFYIGVGASYNWTRFDQSLQGVSGVINVFDGSVLTAQGQEGGPFFDFNRNRSGFAPDVQLGYMHPVAGGDWLAGPASRVFLTPDRKYLTCSFRLSSPSATRLIAAIGGYMRMAFLLTGRRFTIPSA